MIDAVNELIACGLVEKKCRRNRTNVYLLYPPEYFRSKRLDVDSAVAEDETGEDDAELIAVNLNENSNLPEVEGVHDMHSEGAPDAPHIAKDSRLKQVTGTSKQNKVIETGVQVLHSRGAPDALEGCTTGTQGVHVVHPKSTNINNKGSLTLKEVKEAEEREIIEKKFRAEDFEQIKKTFKAKGVQVTDKMIRDLLKIYDVKAVQAAINSCDFSLARNPLAVIKWMLQTGNYVMPVERVAVVAAEEPPQVDEEEEEAIKNIIRQAKENLKRKLVVPPPVCAADAQTDQPLAMR